MFCDLVGSTELSCRIDPEEMRELVVAFLEEATRCVDASGGYVARYMGDGLLAYFGYPAAHEDDVERALRSALAIRDFTGRIGAARGETIAVRVGVATGLTVVGDQLGSGAAAERVVIGETPNLAARLQGIAKPQTIVVSEATRQMAESVFEFASLGRPELKGVPLAADVWELIGAHPGSRPGRTFAPRGDAPLQGRDLEMATLVGAWRDCLEGRGSAVRVVGAPGIGKSRLVRELRRCIARTPHVWLEGRASQISRNTAFHPIRQIVLHSLDPTGAADRAQLRRQLLKALEGGGPALARARAILAHLVGLSDDDDEPSALTPERRRKRLIDALSEWLLHLSCRWPTVLVLEDAQWADPSSLELLDVLAASVGAARVLIIVTSREVDAGNFAPDRPCIALAPLTEEDIRGLATVAGAAAFGDEVMRRAGGIPLFAEELARCYAQATWRSPGSSSIPATLAGILTARLESVGPARDLAQVAAVLDGHIDRAALVALTDLDGHDLDQQLDVLLAAEILTRSPAGGFAFRHALLRDAAYEVMLKARRRALHERAARTIETRPAGEHPAQLELVARHWERAEAWSEAAPAWWRSGKAAQTQGAYHEAERAYAKAIAALARQNPSSERDEQDLQVHTALGDVLRINLGYSAPQAVSASERAHAIARSRGDLKSQFAAGAGAWMAASSAGDYAVARTWSDRLLPVALAAGDDLHVAAARMMKMTSLYRIGRLAEAEEAFRAGRQSFEAVAFRQIPGAIAQTFGNAAVLAWLVGASGQASRRCNRLLALTDQGNPYEWTFAQNMLSMQAILEGRLEAAKTSALEAIALADSCGFPQFSAIARIMLGRATADLEDAAMGVDLIRQGLAAMDGTGSRAGMTMYNVWLAESCVLAGDLEAAFSASRVSLEINPLETFFLPEGLRTRGELWLKVGDREAARHDFRAALAASRAMGSVRLHRRASAALAGALSSSERMGSE
jgi:class 3 adenylate cyclase/tetratricopeptide (TPR) repeat protein